MSEYQPANLENLFVKRAGKRMRVASCDPTGGNNDNVLIPSGEAYLFADLQGPGIVTHFFCTIGNPNKRRPECGIGTEEFNVRKVVLNVYWDDETEPSIQAPLGDFFGMGHGITKSFASAPLQITPEDGRGFNCWFPMPFRRRARFTVKNECCSPLHFYFYVDYAKKMAEAYEEIVRIKAELVEYLAKAQAEAERAEAERKAAEEAQRKAEEAALAAAKYAAAYELAQLQQNGEGLTGHAKEAYDKALADAAAAIEAAKTPAEVDAALAAAREALNNALCPSAAFTDVEENVWYHDGIDFMVRNGYMNGVAADTFDVEGSLTRAQLVTVLYRLAGEPETSAAIPFADVADGQWYTKAIVWAAENGIVNGVNETTFAPNDPITREQIAAILYRYAHEENTEDGKLTSFPDAKDISGYALEAMNWAVARGLINGSDGKLLPQGTATRAQIAVILARYLNA